MDENPYKAPESLESAAPTPTVRKADWWPRFLWGTIGFAGGTVLLAPLVLSIDRADRVLGGMMYGGIPGAIAGLIYGARKSPPKQGA